LVFTAPIRRKPLISRIPIAVIYKEKRLSDLDKNVERGLAQLQEEVDKQRTRVDEAATELASIRVRDGIIDPDPDSFNAALISRAEHRSDRAAAERAAVSRHATSRWNWSRSGG
jgi:capsule polysaccharide export protein KpsE/RkpR